MARWLAGALVVVVAIVGVWLARRGESAAPAASSRTATIDAAPTASPTNGAAPGATPADGGAAAGRRISRVTPERRRAMMADIERARARREERTALAREGRASNSSGAPAVAARMSSPEHVVGELLAAADEIRGYVWQCVDDHWPDVASFQAGLVLTADPDVGTLIDASALAGPNGERVPLTFDDCVRAQLQTLALPPIEGADGFTVDLDFAFDE